MSSQSSPPPLTARSPSPSAKSPSHHRRQEMTRAAFIFGGEPELEECRRHRSQRPGPRLGLRPSAADIGRRVASSCRARRKAVCHRSQRFDATDEHSMDRTREVRILVRVWIRQSHTHPEPAALQAHAVGERQPGLRRRLRAIANVVLIGSAVTIVVVRIVLDEGVLARREHAVPRCRVEGHGVPLHPAPEQEEVLPRTIDARGRSEQSQICDLVLHLGRRASPLGSRAGQQLRSDALSIG